MDPYQQSCSIKSDTNNNNNNFLMHNLANILENVPPTNQKIFKSIAAAVAPASAVSSSTLPSSSSLSSVATNSASSTSSISFAFNRFDDSLLNNSYRSNLGESGRPIMTAIQQSENRNKSFLFQNISSNDFFGQSNSSSMARLYGGSQSGPPKTNAQLFQLFDNSMQISYIPKSNAASSLSQNFNTGSLSSMISSNSVPMMTTHNDLIDSQLLKLQFQHQQLTNSNHNILNQQTSIAVSSHPTSLPSSSNGSAAIYGQCSSARINSSLIDGKNKPDDLNAPLKLTPSAPSMCDGYDSKTNSVSNPIQAKSLSPHPNDLNNFPTSKNTNLIRNSMIESNHSSAEVDSLKKKFKNVTGQSGTGQKVITGQTRGRKKSRKGPFICSECHKEFCNQSTLTKHMITHSDERKFVCPQCSKAFKRHDHLNGHMLTHREHKPYACDIDGCDKSYCDARSLRRHKEKHKEGCFAIAVGAEQRTILEDQSSMSTTMKTSDNKSNDLYLPINASTQLHLLALQQKKAEQDKQRLRESIPNIIDNKAISPNTGSDSDSIRLISNHVYLNSSHQQIANENALLHHLLTSHEKPHIFNTNLCTINNNNDLHSNAENITEQSTILAHSNHNSSASVNITERANNQSVIKINDDFVNISNENDLDNYLQIFHLSSSKAMNQKKMLMNETKKLFFREDVDDINPKTVTLRNDTLETLTDTYQINEFTQSSNEKPRTNEIHKILHEPQLDCSMCSMKKNPIIAAELDVVHQNHHHHLRHLNHQDITSKSDPFLIQKSLNLNNDLIDLKSNQLLNQNHLGSTNASNLLHLQNHYQCNLETISSQKINLSTYSSINSKRFDQTNDQPSNLIEMKSNDNGFRNFFPRQIAPNDGQSFRSSSSSSSTISLLGGIDSEKSNLVDSNHLYHHHQFNHQQPPRDLNSNHRNDSIDYDLNHNNLSHTKGLNEVMFSPITPVTPLKNDQQFTFEFSNETQQNQLSTTTSSSLSSKTNHLQDNVAVNLVNENSSLSLGGNFHPNVDNLNEDRVDILARTTSTITTTTKTDQHQFSVDESNNTLRFEKSFPDNNNNIQSNRVDEFFTEDDHIVNGDENDIVRSKDHSSSFNSFDLPSINFTSDLFNRRAKRNAHLNNPKDLLNIRQIAASLQSIGQNYEQNHQNNNDNNAQSYSVPNTPCLSSAPALGHRESSFTLPSNLSHHSLPSTPIDNLHFTFKTTNIPFQENDNTIQTLSIESNPNEQQQHPHHHHQQSDHSGSQFDFAFVDGVQTDPNQSSSNSNNLLQSDSRNLDLNHCIEDANYTDYLFETKELIQDYLPNGADNFKAQQNLHDASGLLFCSESISQCNHTPNRSDPEQIDQIRTADDQRLRSNVANWEVTNENELFEQPSTERCLTDSNNNQTDQYNEKITLDTILTETDYISSIKYFVLDHNTSVAEKKIKISSHLSEDPATSKNDLWFQQNSINVEESESVKSKAISIGKKIFNENSEDENEIDRDDHHGEQEENDRRDCGGDTAKDIKTIVKTNKSNGYLIKPTQLVQTINRKLTSLTNGSSLNKRNKPRPEPLYIPPHVNTFVFHSRLRSPRLWTSMNKTSNNKSSISPPPYTPPPMLSPVRSGSGLFWKIDSKCSLNSQSSSFLNKKFHSSESEENNETDPIKTPKTAYEPYEINIPTTDIQPHVNIGPNYQARIPEFNRNRSKIYSKSEKAVLCWNPNVLKKIDPETLDLYLKISCSMCLPGHGNNTEYALHLLHHFHGDVMKATRTMIDANNNRCKDDNDDVDDIDERNPSSTFQYSDREVWTDEEIILFRKSILKYDKDFFLISKQMKTKSVKDCIQFYYLWKKNSIDSVKRLRIIRRKRESILYDDLEDDYKK